MATNNSAKVNGSKSSKNKITEFKFNLNLKNILTALLAILFIFYIFSIFGGAQPTNDKVVPISTIAQDIKAGKVKSVEVADNKVTANYGGNKEVVSFKEQSADFTTILKNYGVDPNKVKVSIKDTTENINVLNFLGNIIPA